MSGHEQLAARDTLTPARYIGEVLGGTFRIIRKIGSGGMADVYEVEHLRLGNRFAMKVARCGDGQDRSLRRFLKEAKLLASMTSDHIVKVVDLSRPGDGIPYYVMELLEGRDLRQLIRQSRELSVHRAVKIVIDACRGVQVMHAAGLVHRDLKPENLFVTHRDSGLEICKLLDFGVVKGEVGNSTEHGALVGTVKYMAPEQIQNPAAVGPRSDVYGLGAILYESLSGRPPHVADTLERLIYKVLNDVPAPLRSSRPEIPEELEALVMRALACDTSARHASAQALAEALRPFARDPLEQDTTIAPGALQSQRPAARYWPASRRRVHWALLSLTGVAAASGAVLAVTPGPPPPRTGPTVALEPAPRVLTAASPAPEQRPVEAMGVNVSAKPPAPPPSTASASAASLSRSAKRAVISAEPRSAVEAQPAELVNFARPPIEVSNPYGP